MDKKVIKIFGKDLTFGEKALKDPKIFDLKAINRQNLLTTKLKIIIGIVVLVIVGVACGLIPVFIGIKKAVCQINACKNGATCIISESAEKCDCVNGYSGTNCEYYDICLTKPCKNADSLCNAIDVNKTKYTCSCGSKFSQNKCQNQATCLLNDDQLSYFCKCLSGYEGDFCENYNSCWNSPCEGCVPLAKNSFFYKCTCGSKFRDNECKLGTSYSQVRSLASLNNGKLVAGYDDSKIRIWSDYTFTDNVTLGLHNDTIKALVVLNNEFLISGSCDTSILIWNLTSYNLTNSLIGHTDCVNSIVILNKSSIVSGSSDNTIRFWDLKNAISFKVLNLSYASANSLAYNQYIYSLAIGMSDFRIRLINTTNINSDNFTNEKYLLGHTGSVLCLVFLNNQTLISGSSDKTIKIWKISNDKVVLLSSLANPGEITSLLGFSDGSFASGSSDKTIKIWDSTYSNQYTLSNHSGAINAIVFLNNSFLVTGSSDTTIKIWKVDQNFRLKYNLSFPASVQDISVFDNNQFAVGLGDSTINIINNGYVTQTLIGHKNYVYSLLNTSSYIISGSKDSSIKIWNKQTNELVATLYGHKSSVISLVLLQTNILASGSCDKTIKIWDLNSFTLLTTLISHSDCVNSLANMTESRFASASSDKTIKIWKVKITTSNTYNGYSYTTYSSYSGTTSYSSYDTTSYPSYDTTNSYDSSNYDISYSNDARQIYYTSGYYNPTTYNYSSDYSSSLTVSTTISSASATLQSTLLGHTDGVNCLLILDDKIFSGSSDKNIKIWQIKKISYINGAPLPANVNLIAFLSDDLLAVNIQNSIQIFSIRNPTDAIQSFKISDSPQDYATSMFASSNGNLFVGLNGGAIFLYLNKSTGYESGAFNLDASKNDINFIFSLKNGNLALASNHIFILDSTTLRKLDEILISSYDPYISFFCIAESADGTLIGGSNYGIFVWKKNTENKFIYTNLLSFDFTTSVFVLNNGNLASFSYGNVYIWDMNIFQRINFLNFENNYFYYLTKLSNGNLVTNTYNSIILWGQDLKPIDIFSLSSTSKLVSSNLLLAAFGANLTVLNMDISIAVIKNLTGQDDSVNTLTFLNNGNFVSGSKNGSLIVWSNAFLKLFTLNAHSNSVLTTKLLPSGDLITGSEEKTVKVWSTNIYSIYKTIT